MPAEPAASSDVLFDLLFQGAGQATVNLEDPRAKASGLQQLAVLEMQSGDRQKATVLFKQALGTAEGIGDDMTRSRALQGLADSMADAAKKTGDMELLEKAEQTAESISSAGDRASTMLAIAGQFAAAGRIREARRIAARQPGDDAAALTLATILVQAARVEAAKAAHK